MENFHFETATLVGYGISGALMVLLPIIVFLVWRKRTKAPIVPTIAGAATFFLSAMVFEQIPIQILFNFYQPTAEALRNSVVLYYIVGALLAGIFEETGRFVTMRFFLKKYTRKQNALSFGIGHGGFESLYIGFTTMSLIVLGMIVNSGNLGQITDSLEGAMLETAMEQVRNYSSQTFGGCMLGVLERCIAITAHTAFSMLVFRAVHDKKCGWLYPFAIFLHALFDFILVLYAGKLITLAVLEVILVAIVVPMFLLTYRFVYKPMPEGDGV